MGGRSKQLQKLIAWGCGAITDRGIESLTACSKLQELNVGMCGRLTIAGLSQVGARCQSLHELYVCGCRVDAEALRETLDAAIGKGLVLYTSHAMYRVTFNFINVFAEETLSCTP